MIDHLNRRQFLKSAAIAAAAAPALLQAAQTPAAIAPAAQTPAARLPRRPYKPGVEISVIGFASIMLRSPLMDQNQANRAVASAYEQGCNYFDVAPAYGDAQQKLGPALEPYRKNVFLSCKTKMRDAAGAKAELKRSLELLKTDHFDLYQLHATKDPQKDIDAAFMKGGAMETLLEAQKAGVIRYIGFTTHTTESAVPAMNRFDFDSMMFPFNFASIYKGDYGQEMYELAKKKNVTRIAIKSFCRQEWPQGANRGQFRQLWYQPVFDRHEAEMALRWTMSHEITTTLPPGDQAVSNLAMELALQLKPITPEETKELQGLAASLSPLFRAGRVTG